MHDTAVNKGHCQLGKVYASSKARSSVKSKNESETKMKTETKTAGQVHLTVSGGKLCTPYGAIVEQYLKDHYSSDPLCMVIYDAGDCDSIPWPMTELEHMTNLARSLYDSRECGVIPNCQSVILPNGEIFTIDQHIL